MPLISVIVPCYNQAQYLDECLQSVLDQTYTDWECIIVNDGSPDHTEEIAKKWVEKDARFRYLSKENGGLSSARNAGIEIAKGEWILPLDADDKIGERYLELAEKEFEKSYTVIYCIGEKFGIETGLIKMEEFSLTNLATYNTFFASSFYKKDCWKKINGYDEQMIYGLEDWDFWISLLKNGGSAHKIPEICFFYRIKETSMVTELNNERRKRMHDIISKKHLDFFHEYLGNFPELALQIKVLKRERELFLKAYKSKRYQLGDRIITLIEKLNFLKK